MFTFVCRANFQNPALISHVHIDCLSENNIASGNPWTFRWFLWTRFARSSSAATIADSRQCYVGESQQRQLCSWHYEIGYRWRSWRFSEFFCIELFVANN